LLGGRDAGESGRKGKQGARGSVMKSSHGMSSSM